jgi:DNA-binding response OmpR family regulator
MAHKEPIHVLVADDSAVYRKLVEHALPSALFAVLLAKNGLEAIELFHQHRPEMVITDWVMPDISGIEICRRIRESSEGPYTYIIILTSVTQTENVVRGLAAGADDYLTKPFHAEELLARAQVGHRIISLQRQLEAKNRLLEEIGAHRCPDRFAKQASS